MIKALIVSYTAFLTRYVHTFIPNKHLKWDDICHELLNIKLICTHLYQLKLCFKKFSRSPTDKLWSLLSDSPLLLARVCHLPCYRGDFTLFYPVHARGLLFSKLHNRFDEGDEKQGCYQVGLE